MLDNADTKSSALNIFSFFRRHLFMLKNTHIQISHVEHFLWDSGWGMREYFSIDIMIFPILKQFYEYLRISLPYSFESISYGENNVFTNTLKRVFDSIVIASNLVPRSKGLSRLFVCKDWMRKYCSKYLPPATILPGGGVVRDKWNIFRVH